MKKQGFYPIVPVLLAILLMSSCQQRRQTSDTDTLNEEIRDEQNRAGEYFFDGMFTYMADAASLHESATGKVIPVAMRGAFKEVEAAYRENSDGNGGPLYGQFMGTLVLKGEDEEGAAEQLMITRLLRFDKDRSSDKLDELTGTYGAPEQKLTLLPDHRYQLQVRNGEVEKGRWFLLSEHRVVFISSPDRTEMDINYVDRKLRTEDDNPVIYSYIKE